MALTRRAFAAATAAGVFAPTIASAKECPAAGMDWMTMSLEARLPGWCRSINNCTGFPASGTGPDYGSPHAPEQNSDRGKPKLRPNARSLFGHREERQHGRELIRQ
jgi:hypothetical protein